MKKNIKNNKKLTEILSQLKLKKNGHKISVGEIIEAFHHRGFGPLLLVPALFMLLPTGALPGAAFVCGSLIMLICFQIIIGVASPWIPKRLKEIKFTNTKLNSGIDKITPAAKWIDKYTGPRHKWLITPALKRIIAAICFILALMMIFASPIPFAPDPLALAIILFSLGYTANDGLLIFFAMIVTALSGVMIWHIF